MRIINARLILYVVVDIDFAFHYWKLNYRVESEFLWRLIMYQSGVMFTISFIQSDRADLLIRWIFHGKFADRLSLN